MTARELRDEALAHLRATTVSYRVWERKRKAGRYTEPAQTEWAQALACLALIDSPLVDEALAHLERTTTGFVLFDRRRRAGLYPHPARSDWAQALALIWKIQDPEAGGTP